ncbi:MAG: hypothetical protein ACLFU6_14325 [Candidatus Hydrogenedentota bacterium]
MLPLHTAAPSRGRLQSGNSAWLLRFWLPVVAVLAIAFAAAPALAQIQSEPLDRPQPQPLELRPDDIDPQGAEGLRAEPSRVTFHTRGARAEVRVMRDREFVPTDSIHSLAAIASGNDYSRMFNLRTGDRAGSVIIEGREDALEVGTYEIRIGVDGDETSVTVHAPLDELPNTLEREAERRGVDVETLKREWGLSRPAPREHLSISLPSAFYEGQILRLGAGHEPGRYFLWIIDGEVVQEGEGAANLAYPLEETGAHSLRVEERRDGSRGALVASWEGEFEVREMPAADWSLTAGREFTIEAPAGYPAYTWYVNGREVGSGQSLTHAFEQPGQYELECVADAPEEDAVWAYRRLRWSVQVTN